MIVCACEWTNEIELRANFKQKGNTLKKKKKVAIIKLWKTNRRYVIALHSYTFSICRVKLHDIHYLPLVNEDARWERFRLSAGNK